MRVSVASESGRADGRNEDWAGATSRIAVVLDGLSEGPETGCVHGTPWYVHHLGSRILMLGGDADKPLAVVLAEAIRQVTDAHATTCDLGHPGSPCSTVAVIRQGSVGVEYLVLSDSTVTFDRPDGPFVVTDRSVETIATEKAAAAAAATADRDKGALAALIQEQQHMRNRPGGYWVAQVDPAAAEHAYTGRVDDAEGAVLLTDGATLLVTCFGAVSWAELLSAAFKHGPGHLIAMTRQLEDRDPHGATWPRYKQRDDATAVVVVLP